MNKSWPTRPIGELCSLINGRAFKPSDWGKQGLPIVRIQNLNDSDKPFNHFSGKVSSNHLIDSGEILLSWSGTPGTSFGCFRWKRGPAVLNQHIFKVVVDDSIIDGDFFIFGVNSRLDEMISKAHGGVGLRHITKGKLEGIHLPTPPLSEQRRIVARIKECIERVEEIETVRSDSAKESATLSRSFYSETYQDLLARFPTRKLADAGSVSGGGTPSKQNTKFWKGNIPWVSPKDMKKNHLSNASLHISEAAVAGSSAKLIPAQSVLFVVRGMILIHTLPVAVNEVSCAINQDMKAITPRSGMKADFLATMIRGAAKTLLSKVEVAGHGTKRLQTQHWANLPIPVPSISEQEQILDGVRKFENAVSELTGLHTGRDSSHLRDAILRKAFAGEL